MPIGAGNEGVTGNNTNRVRGAKGGDTRPQAVTVDFPSPGATLYRSGSGVSNVWHVGLQVGNGDFAITAGTGSGQNMPPFLVTNYIIKV
jgi:hypothetical protein